MTNEKKPLNVTQKFVQSMIESTQKDQSVHAHTANDNVNPEDIDKVMMNLKKGQFRMK